MRYQKRQRVEVPQPPASVCGWCDAAPLRTRLARSRAGGRPVRVCSICKGVQS